MQTLLDGVLPKIKALPGVTDVKRVVCGTCYDFKVDIAFDKGAFDETVGGLEADFLASLAKIKGITSVETQTMTFQSL